MIWLSLSIKYQNNSKRSYIINDNYLLRTLDFTYFISFTKLIMISSYIYQNLQ